MTFGFVLGITATLSELSCLDAEQTCRRPHSLNSSQPVGLTPITLITSSHSINSCAPTPDPLRKSEVEIFPIIQNIPSN